MRKLWKLFILLATTTLTLKCPISLAELNLKPKPFSCLSRQQKEKVLGCFEQNVICHQALVKISKQQEPFDWETIFLSVAGGFVAGMILDAQLHH